MDRKSIPNWRPGSFLIPMSLSKRSKPNFELRFALDFKEDVAVFPLNLLSAEHRERPALGNPRRTGRLVAPRAGRVVSFKFDVGCSTFNVPSSFIRRVMGAWWPSRSSKPLPRHFVLGGKFDSYPLRHFKIGFRISDFESNGRNGAVWELNPPSGLGEGRCPPCRANRFLS